MGPFKKYVMAAVEKIRNLEIEVICPSHGPIHRNEPWQYVKYYEENSKGAVEKHIEKYALILYVSAYGYTRDIAFAIGVERKGQAF
jgi:flavorubredoxin